MLLSASSLNLAAGCGPVTRIFRIQSTATAILLLRLDVEPASISFAVKFTGSCMNCRAGWPDSVIRIFQDMGDGLGPIENFSHRAQRRGFFWSTSGGSIPTMMTHRIASVQAAEPPIR